LEGYVAFGLVQNSMKCFFIVIVATLTIPSRSAWLRPEFEDAYVVARSERIVVGHLKANSIKRVPHAHPPDRGRSEEHHVTLVITSVLKGDLQNGDIPLTIHYGLTPMVSGEDSPRSGRDKGAIEIWDTGNSGVSPDPIVEDAREDHLWFLRKLGGVYGREAGAGNWGITDPEDVSSLSLKDYFLEYLSENPMERLKARSESDPALRERAAKFLAGTDLKKIQAEPHPYIRAGELLLFLIRNHGLRKDLPSLARAESDLASLFEGDLGAPEMRGDIMNVWAALKDEAGVDPLVRLLQRQENYWATRKPETGWLATDVLAWESEKRVYAEARHAAAALRRIGDPRAKSEVEATRKRWIARGTEGAEIIQECDRALKVFEKAK
jgi:hypothetical protein